MAQNPNQTQQSGAGAPPSTTPSTSSSSSSKPSDYVYFDRTTANFSAEAVPKAKGAQVKLEHFYKVAVEAAIERNTRSVAILLFETYGRSAVTVMAPFLPGGWSSSESLPQTL